MPWLVSALDVWADGDGWTVNNVYADGRLDVALLEDAPDELIVATMGLEPGAYLDDDMVMGRGNGGPEMGWQVLWADGDEVPDEDWTHEDTYPSEYEAENTAERMRTNHPDRSVRVIEIEGEPQDWPTHSIEYVYSPVIELAADMAQESIYGGPPPRDLMTNVAHNSDIERAVLWAFPDGAERRELILDHDGRTWSQNTAFDYEVSRRVAGEGPGRGMRHVSASSADRNAVTIELTRQLAGEALRAFRAWDAAGRPELID